MRNAQLEPDSLTFKALCVLEEIELACKDGPVPRSEALRFTLAYLFGVSNGTRWPFDAFWKAVTQIPNVERTPNIQAVERSARANASLNGIYLTLGSERTVSMMMNLRRAMIRQDALGGQEIASDAVTIVDDTGIQN